ncbi:caprin-1a [Electrophorus electricus]|uniref:Caprin-1 dimerization domain-containing protein n=1 Tax=Electrophorus electricus TaxID=8005 RepID=A0AAY5ESC6_ELEEL|nr:caprin-1a [Electrophorus electricus]
MPSANVGDYALQSSSPELGSAQTAGAPSEALKQVLSIIEKKVRNMEKRKSKLEDYKTRKSKGEHLNQDQLEALSKAQEVSHNLEFARELLKNFTSLNLEIQKAVKKAARREHLRREEEERRRLKAVLELQYVLDRLGEERVRQELRQVVGSSGDGPLLTEAELSGLDEFYKLVGPERDPSVRLTDQFEEASAHLWELLEGREKAVAGSTYKATKETLDKILLSGYFDRTQTHQNGVCEDEEEEEEEEVEPQAAPAKTVEVEVQPAEPVGPVTQEFTETIEVEATEFVNRQFIPEAAYTGTDKDQSGQWDVSAEVVSSLSQQPVPPPAVSPALVSSEAQALNPVLPPPSSAADPLVRKQAVQDLMAQMQGTYNFMQDSMLEFDGQPLDPAIVSAQPMKSAQMVCAPAPTEPRLPQHSAVPVLAEPTQVSMVSPSDTYSSTPPIYQSHGSDARPPTEPMDPLQVSMALSSEPAPAPSQPQGFQSVSKPLHSGINVNAAPFQSMQTVFNLNAPVPPSNEMDSQKLSSQYQSSYPQAFSTQPSHLVEQQELQQEALQSVVGAFHSQDQGISSSGGHQSMAQPPSGQASGFGRQAQSFYSSRAVPRAGPRGTRGTMNGYRGPSNGFRGGYDGYRPPFPNSPNSGYGQTQFSTPRDYSSPTYQREGYQQSFKRGGSQGSRGSSRGRPYRPGRGMGVVAVQQSS